MYKHHVSRSYPLYPGYTHAGAAQGSLSRKLLIGQWPIDRDLAHGKIGK